MDKIYEKTILDTIELMRLIIHSKDKIITDKQRQKAIELLKEYKSRLSDVEKKENATNIAEKIRAVNDEMV